jgi:1-deoxy-D-xylulose-5-phosphate reductoisomerase
MSRSVVILGSTGSVGSQALDVIRDNPERFRVVGLAAGGGDVGLLARQMAEFRCEVVAVAKEGKARDLRAAFLAEANRRGTGDGAPVPRILTGADAIAEVAAQSCDVVLNGITGSAGLVPTLAALTAGRTVALANKESLVIGGQLVKALARPGQIVPVDSEHSALAQCLAGGRPAELRRLVLTASGGPFRGRSRAELADVTPDQALAHPSWSMGPMITVNSATLVNKGLEIIEAHLLFDIPLDQIDVVVHPQSMIHSMAEFTDGSTIAQASVPDMRLPIALGLAWPERVPGAVPPIDWAKARAWEFFPLDEEVFPAVDLARAAARAGGAGPVIYNAANEECVTAFLAGRLRFPQIVDTIAEIVFAGGGPRLGSTVGDVLEVDRWARTQAAERIRSLARRTTIEARPGDAWPAGAGPGEARPGPARSRRRVLLAKPRGYCAGVDRAVRTVELALERYGAPIYVRKQIVHNTHLVRALQQRGAIFVDETSEVPEGSIVVFSAHGVAPAVRAEAAGRGLQTIDATCPLVTKVHKEAKNFAARDYDILLIGHEGHEEVTGTGGEAPQHIHVIDGADDVATAKVRDPGRVAWLSQTTLSVEETKATVEALRNRFPALLDPPSEDICYATQNRQAAVKEIAAQAELVIVVGSQNSSNSRRLVEVALDSGADKAFLIDDASHLDQAWLADVTTVAVTSGASVPEELVGGVITRLASCGFDDVEEIESVQERMVFALPRELRDG